MSDNLNRRYLIAIKPSLALGLFFCVFIVSFFLGSLLMGLITMAWGVSTTSLRLVTIFQDIFIFILPALVTSMLVTRLPAEFLEIMKKPRLSSIMLMIVALLVSIPAMNVIVNWNANLSFLDNFSWMKEMEHTAQEQIRILMGPSTVGSLVVSVLIIGCLTGVAEELFFRGGIQKLLMCTKLNPHVVIWLTAVIFSLFHFQFYGFVPRVLLGAMFGYLMWWSGSLWLPILAHALNNSLVTVMEWLKNRNADVVDIDSVGLSTDWMSISIVAASVVMTAVAIILLKKSMRE